MKEAKLFDFQNQNHITGFEVKEKKPVHAFSNETKKYYRPAIVYGVFKKRFLDIGFNDLTRVLYKIKC